MGHLLGKVGLARRGHTFCALRHTFETIGGESRDQVAVDAMGHSRDDMASVYPVRLRTPDYNPSPARPPPDGGLSAGIALD